ncbi:UPP phosphoribosyltransferase, partial [Polyodon spathula]|nr:UPP phosphoribosyltransferase [Polyodon spathula]
MPCGWSLINHQLINYLLQAPATFSHVFWQPNNPASLSVILYVTLLALPSVREKTIFYQINSVSAIPPEEVRAGFTVTLSDANIHVTSDRSGTLNLQPFFKFSFDVFLSSLMLTCLPQIRLVVEEGLNQLPYTECTVTTPTGHKYDGVKFEKGNCGVSIMRSGEAMEQGLRDCCRSIRIGKILIQSDEETQKAKVFYAKFPPDIYRRKVLLMYPILSTGNTVIEAVKVLIEHGVQPKHIILLSLFSTPHGAKSIVQEFPDITILTTEVHPVAPTHFGQKYFGTD